MRASRPNARNDMGRGLWRVAAEWHEQKTRRHGAGRISLSESRFGIGKVEGVLPHPFPLPLGEGTVLCDSRTLDASSVHPALAVIPPLPVPIRNREGEGEIVQASLCCQKLKCARRTGAPEFEFARRVGSRYQVCRTRRRRLSPPSAARSVHHNEAGRQKRFRSLCGLTKLGSRVGRDLCALGR